MTLAVCLGCGQRKTGALTRCSNCGFEPVTDEERARSLLLSSHNMPPEQLAEVGAKIEAGEVPSFDDQAIAGIAAAISQNQAALRMPIGCAIAVWTPFVLLVIMLVWIALLYLF